MTTIYLTIRKQQPSITPAQAWIIASKLHQLATANTASSVQHRS